MLEIKDTDLFDDVVEVAMREAHEHCKSQDTRDRWVHAIVKAAAFLRSNDLTFVQYDRENNELLLCAPSNRIYTSNGVCQCPAYASHKQPCYHRAMARLLRRYYERLERDAPLVVYREAPAEIFKQLPAGQGMLECDGCGWRGVEDELIAAPLKPGRTSHDVPACPKCESTKHLAESGTSALPATVQHTIDLFRQVRGAFEGARR